ncbi:MAG: hypothetical protein ACKOUT_05425 [Novosphingobium sp.]
MKHVFLAPLLLLAACGSSNDAPGGVTAGEAKALDEAAEMLEARQLSPSAIPPAPRGEPAAPASTAPAN